MLLFVSTDGATFLVVRSRAAADTSSLVTAASTSTRTISPSISVSPETPGVKSGVGSSVVSMTSGAFSDVAAFTTSSVRATASDVSAGVVVVSAATSTCPLSMVLALATGPPMSKNVAPKIADAAPIPLYVRKAYLLFSLFTGCPPCVWSAVIPATISLARCGDIPSVCVVCRYTGYHKFSPMW